MDKKFESRASKFISLILRHKPKAINIKLDENGWANVEELIADVNKKGYNIAVNDLKKIVLKVKTEKMFIS